MYKKVVLIISLPFLFYGAQWSSVDDPPAGRADDMSIGHHSGGYYVVYNADFMHHLYRSTDDGQHWDSVFYLGVTHNVSCVATNPNDAEIVYIGRDGWEAHPPYYDPVYKSIDAGVSWKKVAGLDILHRAI